MRKIIALLLAAFMALTMVACKQDNPQATTAPTDPTSPSTPAELGELFKHSTYTGSAEELIANRDTVVATLGSAQLTNSVLQLYYWLDVYDFINNYDITSYGLDISKPLDAQACGENGTWQHYFLGSALDVWNYYQALALAAEDEQIPISAFYQKQLDGLNDELTKNAVDGGFASIDAMIQADVGPGCTSDDFISHRTTLYRAYSYIDAKMDAMSFTDEEVEAYFVEHEASLAVNGITKTTGDSHHVRHILFKIGQEATASDWEECRKKAQDVLDQWLAGEATEDSFAALAMEHSEDPGSQPYGGLYRGLSDMTSFLQEFKDWYLEDGRKHGDYGLVKTSAGYHIMFYSAEEPIWSHYCREMMRNDERIEFEKAAMEKYKSVVLFDKILIGEVALVESK